MATTNYSFVKNMTGQILTFTSGSWVDTGLSEPLSYQNFIDKGIQSIDSITASQWSLLTDNNIELIFWSSISIQNVTVTTVNNFLPYQLIDNPKLVNINSDSSYIPKAQIMASANMKLRFALSKDNKSTWYVYRNSTWSIVQITDISTVGMTETEVNAIPNADLSTWFKRGILDIAIWSYTDSITSSLAINSIQVDYPKNEAPLIDNLTLSTTTLGRTDILATATLRDLEGDSYRWRYALRNTVIPNNYAYQFNGGTKFTVNNSTSLTNLNEMTIEFNINIKSLPTSGGWFPIIYKGTGNTAREYSVWLNATGDIGVYYGASTNWQTYVGTSSTDVLVTNTNYHIAAVINPKLGYIKVYRNGILWRIGYVTQKMPPTTSVLTFGGTVETGYQVPNYILDDIRIWNRERTVSEILNNKDIILKGNENNLVGYWKLDEGVGVANAVVKDSTSYSNNATITTVGTGIWTAPINTAFDETKITEWTDWSNWFDSESITSLSKTFKVSDFAIGNNYLVFQVQDERFATYSSTVKTITLNNNNPVFTTFTNDNWSLNGILDDLDGDNVKYKISINGVQKYPKVPSGSTSYWTDWIQTPFNVQFNWSSQDLNLSAMNTVTIDVMDKVGGIYTYTINNIVGRYRNIMFKSEAGDFYTDDLGQVLKYLDMSSITAGMTTPTYHVYVENDVDLPLTNTQVGVNPTGISNFDLQIADNSAFTLTNSSDLHTVNYNGIFRAGEKKDLYLRATSPISSVATNSVWEVDVSGDPT